MSHINRRTLVAGIAGVVPAAAIGAAPALTSPDAELIALGEKLRVAWAAERLAWDGATRSRPESLRSGLFSDLIWQSLTRSR